MSAPVVTAPVVEAQLVETEVLAHDDLAPAATVTSAPHPVAPTAFRPQPTPVGLPASISALTQVQRLANRAVAETLYQVRRVGVAAVAGVAAVVLAATLLLAQNLPQGAAVAALKAQLVKLAPLGKGAAVAAPTGAVLASLPPRGEAPDVLAKVFEEAKAAGVELPRGQYEYVPARDGVAARYRMTFPVRASYPQLRTFIDRTLVALPAVSVEGLRIERKTVGDESVDAEVKLAAFVRSDE